MTVLSSLLSESSQPRDWYGWLTNQAGHAYLVGFPAIYAVLSFTGATGLSAVAIVAAVYFLLWEVIIQRGKDRADQIMDTFHVASGAAVFIALYDPIGWGIKPFALQAVVLAVGVIKRARA
ncbi:hypothetical protein [uncultured Planktomarina sp.]|uniref:hypothetical protein n=1 Tax=uncultured Planktomarina sp. TaxID=1538529 RepID=UPI003260AC92